MKKIILACVFALSLATPTFAQTTALPTSRFVMDVRGSATEVAAYVARLYLDNAGPGAGQIITLTCATTPDPNIQRCTTPIPAVTAGPTHVAEFTVANEAGESLRSNPFNFRLIAIPDSPFNIGIINGQ